MKRVFASWLVDPVLKGPLHLDVREGGDEVVEGSLRTDGGTEYPVRNGIPRFVLPQDNAQRQTSEAFRFKWTKRDTYDSEAARHNASRWYIEKYGFESLDAWAACYSSHRAVLDVGCGSGFSSSLWLRSPSWDGTAMWVGVDISEAVDVARERLSQVPNTHFVQADVLALPFPDESFDVVFSEGVLHHTPSTRAALLAASRVLAPGGQFHFYVYRRKGPVREFTDDYIREQISALSDESAWDLMRPLTKLARVLFEAGAKVEIRDAIPLLGMAAGTYDVQRLIYWHFAKLYWNPALSFEENTHVNFDWYRPRYAHRQTREEVDGWCKEAALAIEWFHEQESGFTIKAVKA